MLQSQRSGTHIVLPPTCGHQTFLIHAPLHRQNFHLRLLHLVNRLRSYSQYTKVVNKKFACVIWVNNTLTVAIIFELI